MKKYLIFLPLIFIWSFLGFSQTYPVKLNRPVKVGTEFRIVAHGDDEITMKMENKTAESSKITVDLEANVKVLEVDEKGHATKAAYTVEKCVRKSGGNETELLAKDRVIIVDSENGHKNLSSERGELAREARQALDLVTSIHSEKSDDDAVFGTTEEKRIGDTWPINVEAAMPDMESKFRISRNDLSGETKLVAEKNINGIKCLEFATKIKAKNIHPSVPRGAKISDAELSASYRSVVPVDLSQKILAESGVSKIFFRGKMNHESKEISFERIGERTLEIKYFDWK